jgi:hypothetical protein
MNNYNVNIFRIFKSKDKKNGKSEIWAEITNSFNDDTIKKRLFWNDENGIIHDGSVDLPVHLRDLVDNAWIEKCKKW